MHVKLTLAFFSEHAKAYEEPHNAACMTAVPEAHSKIVMSTISRLIITCRYPHQSHRKY